MKIFFDFLPVVVFFIAYKLYGVYIATGVAIAAALIQILYVYYSEKRIEALYVLIFIMITVLGGLTLIFHNPIFFKWKPSVVSWLMAGFTLGTQLIGKKTASQHLMEKEVQLPPAVWRRVNVSWAIYFMVIGFVNIYVAYYYDTATWVNFKVFGMLGMTLIFVIIQAVYIAKYAEEPRS